MAELMLISNPRKRRRKAKASARRANPKRRRRVTARRARRRNPVMPLAANPKRRRRRSMTVSRRRRRNPIAGRRFSLRGFTQNTLIPSAVGAAGALGLDVLMGVLPLPAMVKTGPLKPVTRIVGAIGLGMLAGMITNRRVGEQVAAGAVTVVMYDTLKGFVRQTMPALPMAGLAEDYPSMEYVNPAMTADADLSSLSAYVEGDMGVDLLESEGFAEYVEVG